MGKYVRSKIHVNYFDENEKQDKNSINNMNDAQGSTIFGEDKKRSQSKKYRRIGIHLIINEEELDINNSPSLKKCEGCTKNISKKKETKECLIYLEGEFSRTIEKRNEEGVLKPYETLNNIIKKNEWIRKYNEEEKNNEKYNEKIGIIDSLIQSDDDFITILKNSISKKFFSLLYLPHFLSLSLSKIFFFFYLCYLIITM